MINLFRFLSARLIMFSIFFICQLAYAQTYNDPAGFSLTCMAKNLQTNQIVPVVGTNGNANGHWGFATYAANGWPVIIFDAGQLSKMHPIMARFTYYHECAHLSVPTWDEVKASCIGLKNMRKAGHVSQNEEEIIGEITKSVGPLPPKYLGSGAALWKATLQCANN